MIPESESKPGLLESKLESESHDAGIGISFGIKFLGNSGIGIRVGITCYWNLNLNRKHGFWIMLCLNVNHHLCMCICAGTISFVHYPLH